MRTSIPAILPTRHDVPNTAISSSQPLLYIAKRPVSARGEQLQDVLDHEAVLVAVGQELSSVDILLDHEGLQRFASPRVATRNTHGTGCTLSSAIAAGLARGGSLREAVAAAKAYIGAAIAASERLTIGHGHGPVHHFHALWK